MKTHALTLVMVAMFSIMATSGCYQLRTVSKSDYTSMPSTTAYIPTLSQDYLGALNTLDAFLADWMKSDQIHALKLVSASATSGTTDKQLVEYFSSKGIARHAGFEVIGLKKINEDSYQFKVWMYGYAMGVYGPTWNRPSPSLVVVSRKSDSQSWLLKNLPSY